MNIDRDWQALRGRPYFTVQDVAATRGIALPSAHVLCNRQVANGSFVRVKKNFYVLTRDWERYGREDFFRLSNYLRVPSYLSCLTALSYYGISTQIQRNWLESVSQRRSETREIRGVHFRYFQVQNSLYQGIVRQEQFFIATPEKALLDALYLHFLGRYPLDWHALDLSRLDISLLREQAAPFPSRFHDRLEMNWKRFGHDLEMPWKI